MEPLERKVSQRKGETKVVVWEMHCRYSHGSRCR